MQDIGSEDNFPMNLMMELKFEAEHLLSHVLLNKEFPPASAFLPRSMKRQEA